jgi:hypothetical protein
MNLASPEIAGAQSKPFQRALSTVDKIGLRFVHRTPFLHTDDAFSAHLRKGARQSGCPKQGSNAAPSERKLLALTTQLFFGNQTCELLFLATKATYVSLNASIL